MSLSEPSLLKKLQTPTSVSQILQVLAQLSAPLSASELDALRATYQWLTRTSQKHDIDGRVRAQILKLMDDAADGTMLDAALMTYSFSAGHQEVAGGLRATALALLDVYNTEAALWHATRLLHDPLTSRMSGEPGITAVRVLERNQAWLPLYGYLLSASPNRVADVVVEAIHACGSLKQQQFRTIVDRFIAHDDPIYLMAIIDAILARGDRDGFLETIQGLLQHAEDLSLYQFIVAASIAVPSDCYHEWVASLIHTRLQKEQIVILRDLFASRGTDPLFAKVLEKLDNL